MNGHMMKSSILLRMMLLPLVHTKKDVMNTSQLQFRVPNMKYFFNEFYNSIYIWIYIYIYILRPIQKLIPNKIISSK